MSCIRERERGGTVSQQMALYARDWYYDERTRLMLPSAMPTSLVEEGDSAIAYFSTEEALRWRPWPDGFDDETVGSMGPRDATETDQSDAAQLEAHRSATKQQESAIGYASWVSICADLPLSTPLLVRETTQHTGTRIWAAS